MSSHLATAAGQRNVSGTEKRLSCINVPEMGFLTPYPPSDLREPQGSNPLGRLGPEPVRLLPRVDESQPGADQTIGLRVIGVEAELLADVQHAQVLRQDHGGDAP